MNEFLVVRHSFYGIRPPRLDVMFKYKLCLMRLFLVVVISFGLMEVRVFGADAPPSPKSAILKIQGNLTELRNVEGQVLLLSSLASKADERADIRFAAILLLSNYRNQQAVAALLRNISIEDYSSPWHTMKKGKEPHLTEDAYLELGLAANANELRIDGMRTPAVWALRKIGSFAIPQLIKFVNGADADELARRRAGWAVLMIIGGTQGSLEQFLKEHANELNERGRRAFSAFALD